MDPADILPDSSIELTDGFCLVNGDTVVLNHHDIEYYDYGAHLVYLKSSASFAEDIEEGAVTAVWAGGEEIYQLSLWPSYLSTWPRGPIIRTMPSFYPDNIVAIDLPWAYDDIFGYVPDAREDPRVVEALKKYGQYREGLSCEIISIQFNSSGHAVMQLELSNGDEQSYYYLDPAKMGIGLFHYFTNGLTLWDADEAISYENQTEHIQPDPWDSWDLDWMSILEGKSSVQLTISYEDFEEVPSGSYLAYFRFPGPGSAVGPDELNQSQGRIWLGELWLSSEVLID